MNEEAKKKLIFRLFKGIFPIYFSDLDPFGIEDYGEDTVSCFSKNADTTTLEGKLNYYCLSIYYKPEKINFWLFLNGLEETELGEALSVEAEFIPGKDENEITKQIYEALNVLAQERRSKFQKLEELFKHLREDVFGR